LALIKTSNPALSATTFQDERAVSGEAMTVQGTVNKTGILLICAIATAAWTWNVFTRTHDPRSVQIPMIAGLIGGFIFALVTIFKKTWAPVTAPIYALLEGLVLGGISVTMNAYWPGIVAEAVSLTFGTLLVMLLAYSSGLIPVTDKFRLGIVAATGGIAIFYVLEMVLGLFGIHFAAVNGSGAIGIGFSIFVVIVAALNLVLDFDFIETGARRGVPKYMEWYGAFGLMVTLVWLYLEILRLLSKSRSRN